MDYFERYKAVNTPYGHSQRKHVYKYNIDSARRAFLQSPTLSDVVVDNEPTTSIVSIYQKDFYDRQFLFEPESIHAKVGAYIEYRNKTYLILRGNDNDIYPNMYGKLCNEDFLVPMGIEKKIVKGARGNTIKEVITTKKVPIVVDVKGYSIADNAILPLAEGRVIIYMQYKPIYVEKIKINYEFELFNDAYVISDVQLDKITNDEGYLVLSAQKVVEDDG